MCATRPRHVQDAPTTRPRHAHDTPTTRPSGADSGVHALLGGGGMLEGNAIYANAQAGVAVESGAAPTLRRNLIYDGLQSGVLYFDGGMGTMEGNEVYNNMDAGVQIVESSDPTLLMNKQFIVN